MQLIFLFTGILLGALIAYLFLKNKYGSGGDTALSEKKVNELETDKAVLKTQLDNQVADNNRLQQEQKQLKEQYAYELKEQREHATIELAKERDAFNAQLNALREENQSVNITIAKAREAFKVQEEKQAALKEELENIYKKNTTEFENIASKILEEKTEKFTKQNRDQLDVILNPFKENIKSFEEKIEKAYKTESTERIELKSEIKNLILLNQKVSEDANNLAKALKGDAKKQGNWGEVILERVLERSGLIKDQEYKTQFNTTNGEGKSIQPDAIILLPDNKHIVVDAKVSLVAYNACVNAVTEEERELFLKEHLLSVKNHVKQLSQKNYHTSQDFNTPDFTLLFLPIESSFSVAVQGDQELFGYAWDRKIVIVSPTTLLATLRTIASIWKQERQNKNVMEIAKEGGELYDKVVGFLEDMLRIEKAIEQSSKAYNEAVNKLSTGNGNIVRRVQKIQQLGAKTNKDKAIPSRFLSNDDSSPSVEEKTN